MCRRGQAMVETVIAVLIITFVFLGLFRLSQMLMGKVMLEHAAMRVARARAVGFNDFMCIKAARVAVIPAAGKRVWPADGEEFNHSMELARIGIYMNTPNAGVANGVMEYEGWRTLKVEPPLISARLWKVCTGTSALAQTLRNRAADRPVVT